MVLSQVHDANFSFSLFHSNLFLPQYVSYFEWEKYFPKFSLATIKCFALISYFYLLILDDDTREVIFFFPGNINGRNEFSSSKNKLWIKFYLSRAARFFALPRRVCIQLVFCSFAKYPTLNLCVE